MKTFSKIHSQFFLYLSLNRTSLSLASLPEGLLDVRIQSSTILLKCEGVGDHRKLSKRSILSLDRTSFEPLFIVRRTTRCKGSIFNNVIEVRRSEKFHCASLKSFSKIRSQCSRLFAKNNPVLRSSSLSEGLLDVRDKSSTTFLKCK